MRFKVLGPLVAEREGQELHLGGALPRIILATLLLEAGRPVPIERIIEAAWGADAPGTARNQVQIRISQLRRGLGDTASPYRRLVTRPPGYLLRVEPGELDLAEFEELTARAEAEEPKTAAMTLRRALALWRGPVLAGLDSPMLAPVAQDLEERRLLAHEACVAIELDAGRHDELVAELRGLARDHPLRERVHGFLMTALYRSGRQAEALEAFRAYRETLQETLGLEPGDELRTLEVSILNQHPGLDLPGGGGSRSPRAPRQLPPLIDPLVGRTAERGRLRALLAPAPGEGSGDGEPPVAVVVGRPGIGKTALALQVAHDLIARHPDGQLYADLGESRPRASDVLSRFLRALGAAAVPQTEQERAAAFRALTAGRRVLVLLDNAQSAEQIHALTPGGDSSAVLVTARRRPADLPDHRVLALQPLGTAEAVALLTRDIGPARAGTAPGALRELAAQCGGLPLALRIAGARLAARPQWSIETMVTMLGDTHSILDTLSYGDSEVRAGLRVAYDSLSPQARRLLRELGLLDCSQSGEWLASLLTGDPGDARAELVEASLLEVSGGRLRLHDLVRAFARERAAAQESHDRRTAVAERFCSVVLHLAGRAHVHHYGGHFTLLRGQSLPPGPPEREADDLLGDDPIGRLDEEREVLMAAVRLSAAHGLHELCWNLAMTCVVLFETRGYFDDWRTACETALEACRTAGDTRGEAAMLYSLSSMLLFRQLYAEAQEPLSQALTVFDAIGDLHGRALALRNVALLERTRGLQETALASYGRALPLLRIAGDRAGEAHVLVNMAAIHVDADRLDEAETLLGRALAIFRAEGVGRGQAQALTRIALLAVRRGDQDRALELYEEAGTLVRAEHDTIGEAYVLQGTAEALIAFGRVPEARATLGRVLELAEAVGERLIEGRAHLGLGSLPAENHETARRHLDRAHELFSVMGAQQWRARAAEALARL
ncbi:AfsR/SARP family transcriptional regulator [Nonomuraea soli]|uniref:DNA-binding SARP family transcriptional activator/tetratricopeptide (TPR) repeat protein n=1 Tax=Nonomuraea soli TaxID=1032476 RepID=A0A7W0CGI7_9ACTN|nr:BTAD domain-containing putative transcriptional regulator [Nonomuraea soli]MBA2890671.1 DNA-binding SARP family transcriptional activator/tetratricopeptide (TPR) repeat protein [Nonomuraea soli]